MRNQVKAERLRFPLLGERVRACPVLVTGVRGNLLTCRPELCKGLLGEKGLGAFRWSMARVTRGLGEFSLFVQSMRTTRKAWANDTVHCNRPQY